MQLDSSRKAYNYLSKLLTSDVEEFWACALTADKKIIRSACLFRGTVDHCPVHPRDIFRFACLENASSLIVAHNHLSGSAKPSMQDHHVTKKLITAGKLMQIPIIDHLIISNGEYWSFADKRLFLFRGRALG